MRILLHTGAGGAGKTTLAPGADVRAARSGLRALMVPTDPAHSLADALGHPLEGPHRVEVVPGLRAQQLDDPSPWPAP